MAARFERFLEGYGASEIQKRLRPEVSPVSAVMLATRFFLNYFSVEILFGVKNHFGKASEEVIRETADILRRGMLRTPEDDSRSKTRARKSEPAGRQRRSRS